jgi:hypothetical protein
MDAMGYRYEFFSFLGQGHAWLNGNEFQPMVDWMGTRHVVVDPPHVTYVLNGMANEPAFGLNADHAYWVSGLKLRNATVSPPIGVIDVFSHGFGLGDAPATPTHYESGEMQGSASLEPYQMQSRDWEPAPSIPVRDQLDIVATNISEVTINPERARVSCHAKLNVQSDGPITVRLESCLEEK